MSRAQLRPLAESDLIGRGRSCRTEAGLQVAERFFDTAIGTLRSIEEMPGAGSTRLGELCDIPGLRSMRVNGFPCGWFYLERHDHIDVARLLSYERDLSELLSRDDG